jgi:Flp pilus assembly protein TadG
MTLNFCLLKRKGQAIIELTFTFISFVLMLGFMVAISLYLYIHHTVLTAAKEGARFASIESQLGAPATYAAGVTAVQNRVKTFLLTSANINIVNPTGIIMVNAPSGATVGNRTVTVQVNYGFKNPIQMLKIFNQLGGGAPLADEIVSINHTVTMRYEE